ncbi:MAG: RDD family protein [Burkholderiales bacterium]
MLSPGQLTSPGGLGRRFLAMIYEGLLLFALVFAASWPFHGAAESDLAGWNRNIFQAYLFLVIGFYFHWCWLRGGQTLPMKTWKLRLVSVSGEPLTMQQCLLRYVLAWISLLGIGTGFLWAFFDRDRQFLHDRLARTRIVKVA